MAKSPMNHLLLVLLLSVVRTTAAPIVNVNHGQTVCGSAGWDDIILFLVTNYVAHAITVVKFPGESPTYVNRRRLDMLLVPFVGLITQTWKPIAGTRVKASVIMPSTSTNGIRDQRSEEISPRRFCVVEIKHTEQSGPKHFMIEDKSRLRMVRGLVALPSGYGLQRCQAVPSLVLTQSISDVEIKSSYRGAETVVALLQIVFATTSLYRSVGKEIETYGYVSFSLTVLPFAVMSFGNLIACLVSPDYEYFHLVRSPEMAEAIERGACIRTVVGSLVTDDETTNKTSRISFESDGYALYAYRSWSHEKEYLGEVRSRAGPNESMQPEECVRIVVPSHERVKELSRSHLRENFGLYLAIILGVTVYAVPSIVIRLLTNLDAQNSTMLQRIANLSWIYAQQIVVLFLFAWLLVFQVEHAHHAPNPFRIILKVLGLLLRSIGIMGYIMIIRQFFQFGVCLVF